tara:strand:+ start:3489 stop:3722 length:234 start_codon:yes stop_codon:yes gene_type:complete
LAKKSRPLSDTVRKTLQTKADNSRYTLGTLQKVFRRGQGAFLGAGSRPGIGMNQWAMARVNSFIRGSKKHDTDLRKK